MPTHTPPTFQNMAANMDDLKADYVSIGNEIVENRDEIKETTQSWNEKNAYFLKHNRKYDDHWVLQRDKKINSYIHKDEDTLDVIEDDINELLLQENTMYISGTIACATLLVAALFVSSSSD
tara:strand:+ start:3041 stop:3406 length:366 start_codon:yes stop_codon:yes gene_type:complete